MELKIGDRVKISRRWKKQLCRSKDNFDRNRLFRFKDSIGTVIGSSGLNTIYVRWDNIIYMDGGYNLYQSWKLEKI